MKIINSLEDNALPPDVNLLNYKKDSYWNRYFKDIVGDGIDEITTEADELLNETKNDYNIGQILGYATALGIIKTCLSGYDLKEYGLDYDIDKKILVMIGDNMHEYTIKKSAGRKVFNDFCSLLMTEIKGIEKGELIDDFDRAQIQSFKTPNGIIKVYNDYEVDAVYIDSEIKLDNIVKHFID